MHLPLCCLTSRLKGVRDHCHCDYVVLVLPDESLGHLWETLQVVREESF